MKDREKWMRLCEQASREQDPKKMIALMAQIIRLLNEKEDRDYTHNQGSELRMGPGAHPSP